MSSVLWGRKWLRLLEQKIWRLHAYQKAARTTVGNWRIKRWREVHIWAELVQCLDKRSIMMLKSECKVNGPEAWKRLTAPFSRSETPRVMNLLEQLTSLWLKPTEEMTDNLIRVQTLSSSLEVAGEKILEKLLFSVVLKGLPDSYEYFKTVDDFSKSPTPFSDWKKALKKFAESQKLKHCSNSSNTKSEAALFVSRDNSKKFFGKCFRVNKSGQMKTSCTVKQCSFCKKFGHNESKCFQKPKLEKKCESRTNFSQSREFSSYCGSDCSKSKELVLDSSCTSHINCDKDFFWIWWCFMKNCCECKKQCFTCERARCCQNFFAWQARCISRADFKWVPLCSWSFKEVVECECTWSKGWENCFWWYLWTSLFW